MNIKITFTLFLLVVSSPTFASNSSICGETESDKGLLKLVDSGPRTDADYSEKEGKEALKRLQAYLEGKDVPYFIPENTFSIIKGAYLKKRLLNAKAKLKKAKASKETSKYERSVYDLEYRAAKAKSEYCEHQRTEYHIDW